jgi:2-polyprenyl-3-methyl-5-hydroxy-6-metoxy-1,4-benzoquinol methylase
LGHHGYTISKVYVMIVPTMSTQPEYFLTLAAAFVRGKLQNDSVQIEHPSLFNKALTELTDDELQMLVQLGREQGLRLHRFKRTMELPRVHKVLGILKGIQPHNLLDIGSGRGAFLWPLLHEFPYLPITAVDILDYRVKDMQTVHDGGIDQLTAVQASATALPFADRTFDVVTMLEVLEHIPATKAALAEVCRVARRFLILSMPTKEDNNPEHIHLFDAASIKRHLQVLGITRVTIDYVLNHMIVVARIEQKNE